MCELDILIQRWSMDPQSPSAPANGKDKIPVSFSDDLAGQEVAEVGAYAIAMLQWLGEELEVLGGWTCFEENNVPLFHPVDN